ncbi:angiomotin-like [Ylistrum balloti]|uniref:angiomotin-like n=1 Tax=Ylistrum balloti TaxID=509963 RepID=UPI0029058C19|nr:angiomotin-like [Ylistrum balloti]
MTTASSTCSGAYPRSPSPGELSPDPDTHGRVLDSKKMFQISDVNSSPMKKNKRKRSEPRKRTDFSIKRFCPDSPGGGSAGSESGRSSEDVQEDPPDTPDRSNTSSEQEVSLQGPSDSNITPPVVPHGMFLFPGHFPPNYLVPNLHYKHPAFLPNGTGYGRMDLINSANIQRDSQQQQRQQQQQQLRHHEHHNEMEENQDYDEDDYMNDGNKNGKKTRKNYKNMTRERRVEANARERTRVHTISAAFDSLRRAVPSYSYNQKLSKLAILRIASSYINALGRLADIDYSSSSSSTASSPTNSDLSFSELVDVCTRTIQTEGRARRRH